MTDNANAQPNTPEQMNTLPEDTTPPQNPANGHGENGATFSPGFQETPDEQRARLERLGGEPAPDITPEEFARLQQSGQLHIDPRGRIRSSHGVQPDDSGLMLRKRRAWYSERLR
jgi:hypothetical protein